uniref:Uncharacterized protein n=1 Tax=Globodera rostochiensis TaxID=31243 RepID=A0A914HT35_GLORO
MGELWILILVAFFATNSLDKAESVQMEELEELPLQTFDELFVDEWWDKDEAKDLKTPVPTNFGQNVHHQIDRQNTQIGQIEPNSTDHSGQIEPNSTDQLGQIEQNSTDQNPPLTESAHSDNSKNGEEITSNEKPPSHIYSDSEQKELMKRYYEIKDQNPKKISDENIAKMLKIGRRTLCNWKKQFHPNSVDGHSVPENAETNVQEIENLDSESI